MDIYIYFWPQPQWLTSHYCNTPKPTAAAQCARLAVCTQCTMSHTYAAKGREMVAAAKWYWISTTKILITVSNLKNILSTITRDRKLGDWFLSYLDLDYWGPCKHSVAFFGGFFLVSRGRREVVRMKMFGRRGEEKAQRRARVWGEESEMWRWVLVTTGSLESSIFDLNVLWHFSSPLLTCN